MSADFQDAIKTEENLILVSYCPFCFLRQLNTGEILPPTLTPSEGERCEKINRFPLSLEGRG